MPLVVAFLPVIINLWLLASERLRVQNVNDSDVHLQMIRWAEHRIAAGHTPFDGWFATLGLGSPHFHHYQSLPHIIAGLIAVPLDAQAVFGWSLYLLLAFWPLCLYATARLLERDRWEAASIALVAPVVASVVLLGYEHGAYVWRGFGVWSQLWGMWSLPLAWGFTWRAMRTGRYAVLASAAIGLTICFHLLTGYLTFVWIGVVVLTTPTRWKETVKRGAIIAVAGLAVASWLLVPLLADLGWTSASEFAVGTVEADSYGARTVLGWLVTGELFDTQALPVLTVLLAIGLIASVVRARKDDRLRAIIIAFVITLLLYFGRPTFGDILRFIPGFDDAPLERFIIGVHLTGILLAGIGLHVTCVFIATRARRLRLPSSVRAGAVAIAAAAIVAVPYLERADYDRQDAEWIAAQRAADASDGRDVRTLMELAQSLGGGRIYAGLRSNWGADYKIYAAPVYGVLANVDADAIGFTLRTASLSTNVEARFDESRIDDYDLFNVRFFLAPSSRQPPVPATRIATEGRHVLWEIETEGYAEVVDTVGAIAADRQTLGTAVEPFLASDGPADHRYPTIAFGGRPAAAPTSPGPTAGRPGSVLAQHFDRDDGRFAGRVEVNRRAVILVKTSFDPRWEAMVDGKSVSPQMVAPSFVGIPVGPGEHTFELVYRPFRWHLPLIALGALALLAVGHRRSPFAISAPTVNASGVSSL